MEETRADRAEELTLDELAELRRIAYRFLGDLFLYPQGSRLRAAERAGQEVWSARRSLPSFAFLASWQPVLEALGTMRPSDIRRSQEEYLDLFTLGARHEACSPYESSYAGREGLDSGRVAAEVQHEYASAGLALGGAGELPDHVSVELEFMAHLCEQEGAAWRDERAADAGGWLDREATFLQRHVLRWVPRFSAGVARAAPKGFYGRLAHAVHSFTVHDGGLVEILRGLAQGAAVGRGVAE